MSRDPRQSRLARTYLLVALVALLGMTFCLMQMGVEEWSLFPLLLGAVAVLTGWRVGPLLVLGCLVVLLAVHSQGVDPLRLLDVLVGGRYPRRSRLRGGTSLGLDLALCSATLLYLVAQLRLLSITRHVFPVGSREQSLWWGHGKVPAPKEQEALLHRDGEAQASFEVGSLVLTALLVPLAAVTVWLVAHLLARPGALTFPQARAVLFVWLLGLGLAALHAGLSYLRQVRSPPEESRLFLQDQLWEATRWDQSRINRWLVRARLRREKREERR